jgi:hypothetical protein
LHSPNFSDSANQSLRFDFAIFHILYPILTPTLSIGKPPLLSPVLVLTPAFGHARQGKTSLKPRQARASESWGKNKGPDTTRPELWPCMNLKGKSKPPSTDTWEKDSSQVLSFIVCLSPSTASRPRTASVPRHGCAPRLVKEKEENMNPSIGQPDSNNEELEGSRQGKTSHERSHSHPETQLIILARLELWRQKATRISRTPQLAERTKAMPRIRSRGKAEGR